MIELIPQGAMAGFTALLLAHVLADFLFQPAWMVARKRNILVLLLHSALVFIFSTATLGGVWEVALLVAALHFVIDALKVWALPQAARNTLTAFLVDQALHMVTLMAAALYWPGAFAAGAWGEHADLLIPPALLLAGFITAVAAGGFAVGLLTARFQRNVGQSGLPDAGRLIGQLERALIFLLMLIGQPAGVGFLIAAKSVLRFDTAKEDQKASEYVIIGTLASFGWALAASVATLALLDIAQSLS